MNGPPTSFAKVTETYPPLEAMRSPVEVRVKATPVVSLVAGATTRDPPSWRMTTSSPLNVPANLKVETGVPVGPTVAVVVTVAVTLLVYVM